MRVYIVICRLPVQAGLLSKAFNLKMVNVSRFMLVKTSAKLQNHEHIPIGDIYFGGGSPLLVCGEISWL